MTTNKKKKTGYRVVVDQALCDGCGVCIFFCKPRVFSFCQTLSSRGYYAAEATAQTACTNCGLCVLGCPQLAIFVGDELPDAAEEGQGHE